VNNDYNKIVKSAEQTCSACPTQWQGMLRDGRAFYFRYRWGTAWFGVGHSLTAAVEATLHRRYTGEPMGGVELVLNEDDPWDGDLDDDQYQEALVKMYRMMGDG
jgi:hypothetical protein